MNEMLLGRKCLEACGLKDIPFRGNFFTWRNKQAGEDRVFSNIDRIMIKEEWLDIYDKANALFMSEGVSNHSPAMVRMENGWKNDQKPYKYYRMWSHAPDYKESDKGLVMARTGYRDV
ncbi:hypothetical protein RDABS01_036349 [Bienertia sinuspersici]